MNYFYEMSTFFSFAESVVFLNTKNVSLKQELQCSVFILYTPVYTKNFQKLHLHNTLCKIKIGVLKKHFAVFWKKNWCGKCSFYTEKKIGAKILHCVIFVVFFKQKEGSKNKKKM
jgi:hypothetical protein